MKPIEWMSSFYPSKFISNNLLEIYIYILKIKCKASSIFPGPYESGLIYHLGDNEIYIFKNGS